MIEFAVSGPGIELVSTSLGHAILGDVAISMIRLHDRGSKTGTSPFIDLLGVPYFQHLPHGESHSDL